ncbi:Uu.00g042390.m01.CDS01 [Anthostomella pinea]|uniref:Uu.00g042390.m01.CDS01 n=1 Tax=Anthostomella pinea TaxID=933095 RepID=A0AAI8VBK8_9PEZI|nr:Uu.00g042390.m01.CDS01 [Anthostomella pinea]
MAREKLSAKKKPSKPGQNATEKVSDGDIVADRSIEARFILHATQDLVHALAMYNLPEGLRNFNTLLSHLRNIHGYRGKIETGDLSEEDLTALRAYRRPSKQPTGNKGKAKGTENEKTEEEVEETDEAQPPSDSQSLFQARRQLTNTAELDRSVTTQHPPVVPEWWVAGPDDKNDADVGGSSGKEGGPAMGCA